MLGRLATAALGRTPGLAARPAFTAARRRYHLPNSGVQVSGAVRAALAEGGPVVALESTIITHGMPFPQNLETALQVEAIVRQNGAVPATVAVLDGHVRVGLDDAELERLARIGMAATKTSRRDMALVAARGLAGATTVSATMIAAHKANIKVFVTGGIGGVHRGGESSMDVSADLTELGRTPVAVVSAGVKSILDIGRTLEYLETQGVTVVSYGDSDEFPSFYTRQSGFKSMANLATPEECATLIYANASLGLGSGMVIAVPIPEKDAFPHPQKVEQVIQDAVLEGERLGIRGKDITPFILDKVKSLTAGSSLAANISLVKNNARVGSQIAVALSRLSSRTGGASSARRIHDGFNAGRPLIVGGTVLDITAKFDDSTPKSAILRTSSPGTVFQSLGGVGRNVAEACQRAGGRPVFVSAVGDDRIGQLVLSSLQKAGLSTECVDVVPGAGTATYNAVLHGDGELLAAVADMRVHDRILERSSIADHIQQARPPVVCVDGNLAPSAIAGIARICAASGTPLCFEPTSVIKSRRVFELTDSELAAIQIITPNADELVAMSEALDRRGVPGGIEAPSAMYSTVQKHAWNLLRAFPLVILKLGRDGVFVARRTPIDSLAALASPDAVRHRGYVWTFDHLEPTKRLENAVSVTGAGDSLVGVLIAGLSPLFARASNLDGITNASIARIVRSGMRAAELSLGSQDAISSDITPNIFGST
ncbi:hypothetical protein HK105_208298 [Polyrhizophydium stewartii]|uniref:Carbohydrate kinase PfkB domain-containing protein n=1 Tax=Polyrhizophydium stewartii TaxID=2732419 RepID=A0ABR4MY85_9FUNG